VQQFEVMSDRFNTEHLSAQAISYLQE